MRLTTLRLTKTLSKSAVHATEQHVEVKAPWGKIAAITWGSPSKPPVLLCPGRFDTCATYRPLVSLLPDEYFYVGIDQPGNGLSDPFPKGLKFTAMDFLHPVLRIKEHFKWDTFFYIGHSLGGVTSKYYNMVYPGQMKKIVDLDPLPAYIHNDKFRRWYLGGYAKFYSEEEYQKFNSGSESAPKYTYEEVKQKLMQARGLDETVIEYVLERCLEPTEDGLFRLTFDQRFKLNFLLPFPKETLRQLYTESQTPTLAILATESLPVYNQVPFVMDDSAWPNGNYRHVLLDSGHDVHVHRSAECAALITDFLKESS